LYRLVRQHVCRCPTCVCKFPCIQKSPRGVCVGCEVAQLESRSIKQF
jgi:hypothetical protein